MRLAHKEKRFLVDANILLYARNHDAVRGRDCERVLVVAKVAVTQAVLDEVKPSYESKIETYGVKGISAELRELWTDRPKQPSLADLSLVQAALENPEIIGIITYDRDFKAIATRGFIHSKSSKSADDFWVGTAKEYLEKTQKNQRKPK
jgi:predicted nucleic acid-binding protein